MSIPLTLVRKLNLAESRGPGRPSYITSASGLIKIDNTMYVVADDELDLGVFTADAEQPVALFTLLPGSLPSEAKSRKKAKPDLESLFYLSAERFAPAGAILTVPSGSKPNRTIGALLALDELRSAVPVDFSALYSSLLVELPELNIEGAVVSRSSLILLQRGNGKDSVNAVVRLDLDKAVEGLLSGHVPAHSLIDVQRVELGSLRGAKLGFTDATIGRDGQLWFLAAAEATESTYDDGEYRGSVLGCLDPEGKILRLEELACAHKPEGLCFEGDGRRFYVVTDADDVEVPSCLYVGESSL